MVPPESAATSNEPPKQQVDGIINEQSTIQQQSSPPLPPLPPAPPKQPPAMNGGSGSKAAHVIAQKVSNSGVFDPEQLRQEIRSGIKLRRVETIDKSRPFIQAVDGEQPVQVRRLPITINDPDSNDQDSPDSVSNGFVPPLPPPSMLLNTTPFPPAPPPLPPQINRHRPEGAAKPFILPKKAEIQPGDRDRLLAEIKSGARLRPTQTIDKSRPVIGDVIDDGSEVYVPPPSYLRPTYSFAPIPSADAAANNYSNHDDTSTNRISQNGASSGGDDRSSSHSSGHEGSPSSVNNGAASPFGSYYSSNGTAPGTSGDASSTKPRRKPNPSTNSITRYAHLTGDPDDLPPEPTEGMAGFNRDAPPPPPSSNPNVDESPINLGSMVNVFNDITASSSDSERNNNGTLLRSAATLPRRRINLDAFKQLDNGAVPLPDADRYGTAPRRSKVSAASRKSSSPGRMITTNGGDESSEAGSSSRHPTISRPTTPSTMLLINGSGQQAVRQEHQTPMNGRKNGTKNDNSEVDPAEFHTTPNGTTYRRRFSRDSTSNGRDNAANNFTHKEPTFFSSTHDQNAASSSINQNDNYHDSSSPSRCFQTGTITTFEPDTAFNSEELIAGRFVNPVVSASPIGNAREEIAALEARSRAAARAATATAAAQPRQTAAAAHGRISDRPADSWRRANEESVLEATSITADERADEEEVGEDGGADEVDVPPGTVSSRIAQVYAKYANNQATTTSPQPAINNNNKASRPPLPPPMYHQQQQGSPSTADTANEYSRLPPLTTMTSVSSNLRSSAPFLAEELVANRYVQGIASDISDVGPLGGETLARQARSESTVPYYDQSQHPRTSAVSSSRNGDNQTDPFRRSRSSVGPRLSSNGDPESGSDSVIEDDRQVYMKEEERPKFGSCRALASTFETLHGGLAQQQQQHQQHQHQPQQASPDSGISSSSTTFMSPGGSIHSNLSTAGASSTNHRPTFTAGSINQQSAGGEQQSPSFGIQYQTRQQQRKQSAAAALASADPPMVSPQEWRSKSAMDLNQQVRAGFAHEDEEYEAHGDRRNNDDSGMDDSTGENYGGGIGNGGGIGLPSVRNLKQSFENKRNENGAAGFVGNVAQTEVPRNTLMPQYNIADSRGQYHNQDTNYCSPLMHQPYSNPDLSRTIRLHELKQQQQQHQQGQQGGPPGGAGSVPWQRMFKEQRAKFLPDVSQMTNQYENAQQQPSLLKSKQNFGNTHQPQKVHHNEGGENHRQYQSDNNRLTIIRPTTSFHHQNLSNGGSVSPTDSSSTGSSQNGGRSSSAGGNGGPEELIVGADSNGGAQVAAWRNTPNGRANLPWRVTKSSLSTSGNPQSSVVMNHPVVPQLHQITSMQSGFDAEDLFAMREFHRMQLVDLQRSYGLRRLDHTNDDEE